MTRKMAWGWASAAMALGVWGCTSDAMKSSSTKRTSNAETAIDWRYGPCPENEPIPDPSKCGFPPGAAAGVLTTTHGHMTCANVGVGNHDAILDTRHTPNDPELNTGLSWPLAGGNKFILWSPEEWFFASSAPVDALIVHFTAENGPDDHSELSLVYRYDPATYASQLIQGYGFVNDDRGAMYLSYAIEVCYTLPGSPPNEDGAGGFDAGTPDDAGTVTDAGGGTSTDSGSGTPSDAGDDASTPDAGSTDDGGTADDGGTTTTTF